MRRRLYPPLILAGLALVYFADLVLHPTQVLYSDYSDLLAQHVPAKRFLVRSWRETGELPLWCPYGFAGMPFVHDIQVAAFYPPHWPLYFLREDSVGAALSWSVFGHVLLAGWAMYAYARTQRLRGAGALVAALGYMFAGKWLLHLLLAGHYILVGLAWLPLVVLALEQAIRRASLVWATAAGTLSAVLILGTQPQWTFYAGLLVVLWSLGSALDLTGLFGAPPALPRSGVSLKGALARWVICGLWAALVAVGLAAVQLLPTRSAAAESARAAGLVSPQAFGDSLKAILFLIGPAINTRDPNLMWEDRAGLTVLWLTTAVFAGLRGTRIIRYRAGVGATLLLFALGAGYLVQDLPGFQLFHSPSRMFVLVAFPLAFLAGSGTQMLFAASDGDRDHGRRARTVLVRVLAVTVILAGGFALRLALTGQPSRSHLYWDSLLVTVPAAYWLLGRVRHVRHAAMIWTILLLVDAWALLGPLVQTRDLAEVYAPSACVRLVADRAKDRHVRVLDRDTLPNGSSTPLGSGAPLAFLLRLEALRGYNPMDVLRFKEYLQFIGGSDAPLKGLSGSLTNPVLLNIPVKNKNLLDLLIGPGYLLQPAAGPVPHSDALDLALGPAYCSPAYLPVCEDDGWGLVAEDPRPRAYDFIEGGVQPLPPYKVYKNRTTLSRAFVVFRSRPLPERDCILATLRATDFTKEVLLENYLPHSEEEPPSDPRPAKIVAYQPNRVAVEVADGPEGWLVLADVMYSGWECAVDGEPACLHRANYLFRAARVPPGRHLVSFTFRPLAYFTGRTVSLVTLGVVAVAFVFAGIRFSAPRRGREIAPSGARTNGLKK